MDDNGQDDSLSMRLARLWRAGDRSGFFALVASEAMEKMQRMVARGLRLQPSDAEDCVSYAVEGFLERDDLADVEDPYAYLRRSAWNQGATLHRNRRRELVLTVEALSSPDSGDAADALVHTSARMRSAWAVVAVEEAVDDIEAEESWAVAVVEAALETLTAKQRALIIYLSSLEFDFERQDFQVLSQEAADALGMKAPAFRKAKQRAYEALATAIPAVIASMEIQPNSRFVSAFDDRRKRLTEQNDDEAGA